MEKRFKRRCNTMLIISELFGVLLGFVLSTVLLIGSLWFEKSVDPESTYSCSLIKAIRSFAFTGFFYSGLIFIYIFIQGVFTPLLGPTTLIYRLGGLLLSLFFGIYLIFGTALTAPNWKTVVCSIGSLICFLIWTIPGPELRNIENPFSYFTGLFVFWLFQVIILGIASMLEYKEVIQPRAREYWNITAKFKKTTKRRVMIVFWMLFSLELFLRFYGFCYFFIR